MSIASLVQQLPGSADTLLGRSASDASRDAIVAAGGLPPLIDLLETPDPYTLECVTGTLWNISASSDEASEKRRDAMLDAGIAPPLVRLMGILDGGNVTVNAAGCTKYLAAFSDRRRSVLISAGAVERLLKLLHDGSPAAREQAAGGLSNLANCPSGCQKLIPLVPEFIAMLPAAGSRQMTDIEYDLFGCLANITRLASAEQLATLRHLHLPEIASSWIEVSPQVAVDAACMIANLLGHLESHPLLTRHTALVVDLCQELQLSLDKKPSKHDENLHFDAWALGQGIANLSVSETNKQPLLDAGSVPLLYRLIHEHADDKRSIEYGTKAIANLSFVADIESQAPGITAQLEALAARPQGDLARKYAQLALFQSRQRKIPVEAGAAAAVAESGADMQVMISYPWKHQAQMIWLKEQLVAAGFKVWMDIDQMSASILEAMANAVEQSAVVVVCVCREYKESEACRTEGEYTFRLRKKIVPVMVEEGYTPDGWLGALIGNKLYFNLARERDAAMPRILKELERVTAQTQRDELAIAPSAEPSVSAAATAAAAAPLSGAGEGNRTNELLQQIIQKQDEEIRLLQELLARPQGGCALL